MIRRLIYWVLLLFVCMGAHAQFRVTAHQEGWDRIPPQAQKDGFWFQQSVLANMDDDAAMEEVMLFGRDNGHYPTFDLFKFYYVIVDNYTKEIQYISDGKFTVDERGYNLRTTRCYDRIEWSPESKNIKPQQP